MTQNFIEKNTKKYSSKNFLENISLTKFYKKFQKLNKKILNKLYQKKKTEKNSLKKISKNIFIRKFIDINEKSKIKILNQKIFHKKNNPSKISSLKKISEKMS